LESISVRLGGRMITVVPSGNIYLAAVHEVSRLTLGQLRLIERVAREVAWLVGRRGYVAA